MKEIFLILASVITIASVIPYARDILKGRTRPNIVSWITWSLLTGVATIAEFAAHEYVTAIFTLAAVIETTTIVILGLRFGYAKYTLFDGVCQAGALFGFVLWWLFNSPVAAVIASVSIDLIGVLPTIRHSYIAPYEETWITYAMSGVGGAFALLALSAYNWASLTYPIYIVFANIVLVTVILQSMKRVPEPV